MNNVTLVGRLSKDPDLRFTPGKGTPVTRFNVAVKKRIKDAEGNYGADFIQCLAFGKTAENIANYFTKGREIAIVGSLSTGSYEDKQGVKRYTTNVIVNSFDFVGTAPKGNTLGTQDTGFGSQALVDDMMPVDDNDVPF